MTIGQKAETLIKQGKTNAEVAAAIRRTIKGAKTSPGSVAWYRSKLRLTGRAKPKSAKPRTH